MTDEAYRSGESALLALIYPTRTEDMRPPQLEIFYEAAAEQERYAQNGGRAVASEAVGDVRVTYRDGVTWTAGGEEISPVAVSMLVAAGLLNRWI